MSFGKSIHHHVPGGPIVELQAEALEDFEQTQGLFIQRGSLDRNNQGHLWYEHEMTDTRILGGQSPSARGFASERSLTVDEFISAPYSPLPLERPLQGSSGVMTHTFEVLAVYRVPKRGILGLLHMVTFGPNRSAPDPEAAEFIDQSLVFDDSSHTVKYRKASMGSQNPPSYHEFSSKDKEPLAEIKDKFVAQEFGELFHTHIPLGTGKLDRTREKVRTVRNHGRLFVSTFSRER